MKSRFLPLFAVAFAATSLWAQGMHPLFLGSLPAPLEGARPTAWSNGKAEGLPLDSPEAEACLASVRKFVALWQARDYEGVFRWMPASRRESLRRMAAAFFAQFDDGLAAEINGLTADLGAAMKKNAALLRQTALEKWGLPAEDDAFSAEWIAAVGERLTALADLSRADLSEGRVEPLLAQLGAIAGTLEGNASTDTSLRQEVTRVRSSGSDGSFSLEEVITFPGGHLATTNAIPAVLLEGVWVPENFQTSLTREKTDEIVSKKIPELMGDLFREREKIFEQLVVAREAARRMAAAATVDEMDEAGRAFVAAAFSVDDDGVPEIPDQP